MDNLIRQQLLGEGTFGQVWKVSLKNSSNQPMALKVMKKTLIAHHKMVFPSKPECKRLINA